ncbi:MAG TPA: glutathione S-transferase family protein [Polyangiaceae bacterium]|nr:glutathione S-transferase family protein [Polyangiaceae bacterium]
MLELFYYPSNASLAPHVLLEELGASYELRLVDRDTGALDSPAYRRLNPSGLIPALRDGELVLFESAAICLHLCDTHPDAGFAPHLGTPERAHFYKWLSWLSSTLQPTILLGHYAARWCSDSTAASELRTKAESRASELLSLADAELARHGGPFLLGERYTALDAYALMLCRWSRNFARPARRMQSLGPYVERLLERPATIRAFEQERLPKPWA